MKSRQEILEETKKALIKSITPDLMIIKVIQSVDELTKVSNRLTANIRERYNVYAPDTAKNASQEELLKAIKGRKQEELSIPLKERDFKHLESLAEEIKRLNNVKEEQENYLDVLMKETCPHLQQEAGTIIGARLLAQAGSLKNLARMASSKIQVLGAEKALFKHLKSKANPPKFGIIFAHTRISESKEKGKAARHVAADIAKAAKMDYFSKK